MIVLLIALSLTMGIAAFAGCSNGAAEEANNDVSEKTQQIVQDERVENKNNTDCEDDYCKYGRDGENRKDLDLNDDETDENKLPEHRHRPPHEPKKGHRHGHRPHPRPMPRQYR